MTDEELKKLDKAIELLSEVSEHEHRIDEEKEGYYNAGGNDDYLIDDKILIHPAWFQIPKKTKKDVLLEKSTSHEKIQYIKGTPDKKEEQQQERDNIPWHITSKEILKLPNKLRNIFKTIDLSKHTRQRKNGTYEIRIMIQGINYYGASTDLEEAKERFLDDIIKKSKKPKEPSKSTTAKKLSTIDTSVEKYAYHYLETFKKPNICKKAFVNYQRITNNHIVAYFKGIDIKDVTASDCQNLLRNILNKGTGRIAEDVQNLLRWIFDAAVADKIISVTPMRTVQIPKHIRKKGKQIPALLIHPYLSNEPQNRYDYIIRLIIFTGLRPIEIQSAVFEDGFITVKNAKQKADKEPTYRRIPIHSALLPYIQEIKKYLSINQNNLAKYFKKHFPIEFRLYDLRHTFTSRIQECGANKSWVDYVTNHTTAQNTTDRIYTHWSDEFQLQEIEKLNFSPKSVPKNSL